MLHCQISGDCINPNIAHILYTSDDRFAAIFDVSLVSLYEASEDMEGIAVYVLDSGMIKVNQIKSKSISEKHSGAEIK